MYNVYNKIKLPWRNAMRAGLGNIVILNAMSVYGGHCLKRYRRIAKKSDNFGEKLLLNILKRNKNTELGKKLGFSDIKSIRDYQLKVPYSVYDDYADYIERMAKGGEQNLVTADRVSFFATTSGTTGVTKRIPVVKRSYKPILRAAAIIYRIIRQNMKGTGAWYGKGLNTLESVSEHTESGIRQGYISSYVMSSAKHIVPAITCIPKEVFGTGDRTDMKYIKARYSLADRDLVYLMSVFMSTTTDMIKYILENSAMLIRDIETGAIDSSVKLPPEVRKKLEARLRPDPKRAEELRRAIDPADTDGIVARIWPKVSTVVAIGTGEFETFSRRMRAYCGPKIHFCHEMYAASEAILASSIEADNADYFMIPDSGFFEFIPVDDDFDERTDRPLLMHELEEGKHYEVVVTNLAGLYRYRIKDVIKVTGHAGMIPLIRFAYRKEQMINITGIKLTSEHMVSTMRALSARLGVNIIDYSIYADTDAEPWHIKAFIEFEGDIPEETELDKLFDEELAKVNEEHGRMLRIGESSSSVICVMHRNAYRELRSENAAKKNSDSQVKTIRYIGTKAMNDSFMKKVSRIVGEGK